MKVRELRAELEGMPDGLDVQAVAPGDPSVGIPEAWFDIRCLRFGYPEPGQTYYAVLVLAD